MAAAELMRPAPASERATARREAARPPGDRGEGAGGGALPGTPSGRGSRRLGPRAPTCAPRRRPGLGAQAVSERSSGPHAAAPPSPFAGPAGGAALPEAKEPGAAGAAPRSRATAGGGQGGAKREPRPRGAVARSPARSPVAFREVGWVRGAGPACTSHQPLVVAGEAGSYGRPEGPGGRERSGCSSRG